MDGIDNFSKLNDDLLIKIIVDLNVKDCGIIACVSKRFCSILHEFCYQIKCTERNPVLVSDLLLDSDSSYPPGGWAAVFRILFCCPGLSQVGVRRVEPTPLELIYLEDNDYDRRLGSHLAKGRSCLSREQGNELLDNRFGKNCLYVSKWISCGHNEGENTYFLYSGIFVNFKQGMIWRALKDSNKFKTDLKCAFCSCKQTWDLYSSVGLKSKGIKLDCDVPVDRAFVCENGHVFGAWINVLMFNTFRCKMTCLPILN